MKVALMPLSILQIMEIIDVFDLNARGGDNFRPVSRYQHIRLSECVIIMLLHSETVVSCLQRWNVCLTSKDAKPILANGFNGRMPICSKRNYGFPSLTENDESTIVPGNIIS